MPSPTTPPQPKRWSPRLAAQPRSTRSCASVRCGVDHGRDREPVRGADGRLRPERRLRAVRAAGRRLPDHVEPRAGDRRSSANGLDIRLRAPGATTRDRDRRPDGHDGSTDTGQRASAVIVTVPVGALAAGRIEFAPGLARRRASTRCSYIGTGPVIEAVRHVRHALVADGPAADPDRRERPAAPSGRHDRAHGRADVVLVRHRRRGRRDRVDVGARAMRARRSGECGLRARPTWTAALNAGVSDGASCCLRRATNSVSSSSIAGSSGRWLVVVEQPPPDAGARVRWHRPTRPRPTTRSCASR